LLFRYREEKTQARPDTAPRKRPEVETAPYLSLWGRSREVQAMRNTILLIGALGALSLGAASAEMRRGDQLDWRPAPPDLPRGAQVSVLMGDPAAPGPFVVRLRAPAGYQVAAHKHPDVETITVLSGALRFGEGQRLDPQREQYLHAGDFTSAPAGMGHWLVVNEDAVLQVTGMGPWKIDYLDPRDNPQARGAALD
jgi:quercetin dioxygenase-like cupin family protein